MKTLKLIAWSAAALGTLLCAAPAAAQDGYLLGSPLGSLTLRLGGAHPAASDDLFRFMTDNLTLGKSDFASFTAGIDLNVKVHRQVDFVVGFSTAQMEARSEFRDFVEDPNDLPIEQTTELVRTPVTAGLRVHLTPRGRSLGRYAFVPNKFNPYVGAGGGVMYYRITQDGDFVDFETLDIFTEFFEDSGWTPTWYAQAGTDIWLLSRLGLNLEARYNWAKDELDEDFADFDNIDLRGLQWSIGITLR